MQLVVVVTAQMLQRILQEILPQLQVIVLVLQRLRGHKFGFHPVLRILRTSGAAALGESSVLCVLPAAMHKNSVSNELSSLWPSVT